MRTLVAAEFTLEVAETGQIRNELKLKLIAVTISSNSFSQSTMKPSSVTLCFKLFNYKNIHYSIEPGLTWLTLLLVTVTLG